MSDGIIVLIGLVGILFETAITQARSRAGMMLFGSLISLVVSAAVAFSPKVTFGFDNRTISELQSSRKKEVVFNKELACVSDCNSNDPLAHSIALQITVVSFIIDEDRNQTLVRVRLKSQHNESDCHFGSGEGFQLQDETGKTYLPSGQLKNGGSFSLVKGEPITLTGLYSFAPLSGSIYTLRPLDIYCYGHSVGYTPTYGDVQFEF